MLNRSTTLKRTGFKSRAPTSISSDPDRARATPTVTPGAFRLPEPVASAPAAPIAKAVKKRVRTDAGLIECDFGTWTGANLKDLAKLPEWKTVQRYPSGFRFPKGESFAEMQARITGAIDRLVARHPGGTVVAVSHADPIKAAVAQALGTHLDLFQRIVISPCSVTAILYTATGPVVLSVNSTGGDLTALAPS